MKKLLAVILSMATLLSAAPAHALEAESAVYYASVEEAALKTQAMALPAGVTEEMCDPSYWYDKGVGSGGKVLADQDQLQAINAAALKAGDAHMYDLEHFSERYNADSLLKTVSKSSIPTRDLYINGKKINNQTYFEAVRQAIQSTGYTETSRAVQYAVATARADMRDWPIDDVIGYSASDPDDEMQSTSLLVNEPFIIQQRCERQGKTYYWGYTSTCSGWINGERLAICADKAEWLDAWKVDPKGKGFLVVTQNKIVTEASIQSAYSSQVKLTLGTVLKLVPEDKIPQKIGERGDWFNHVVYLPTRNENGRYVKRPCLISANASVSIGYLPFTQKNLLNVAFSCLGDRYGWGGMLDAMDCSMYMRNIYRCFGFELPRNTTWQQCIPNTRIDVSQMSDSEKQKLFSTLPSGALLYFPGHTMMYTGTVDGINYVISNTGSVVESTGPLSVKSVYGCVLNPLTLRRKSGQTWLQSMTAVVLLGNGIKVGDCSFTYDKSIDQAIGSYQGTALWEGVNFTTERQGSKVVVTGLNNLSGSCIVEIPEDKPTKTSISSVENGKKGTITVKWKKNTSGSGYQLQYSTSKTFAKDNKTVSVTKNSATSKDISGLTKGKTYYVRIRTYKTSGSKKIYSGWSGAKSIKIKK